jgi:polar amino acid transport system substrate-binding protein
MKTAFFLILFFLMSTNLFAIDVNMGFGESLPPYIISESYSGIELDIVREALVFRGHILKPDFFPMARLAISYQTKKVDAIMMDVGEKISPKNGYYGDIPVLYQNVFITLKKNKRSIKKPEDLKGLSINGFIGASIRYPKWFTKVIKEGTYFEKNDQLLQVLQLSKGRIDVVLSDYNIFKYYFIQTKRKTNVSFSDFEVHDVVKEDPMNYRPVFCNKKVRDDFNLGLKHLRKIGRIKAIYDKYLKE